MHASEFRVFTGLPVNSTFGQWDYKILVINLLVGTGLLDYCPIVARSLPGMTRLIPGCIGTVIVHHCPINVPLCPIVPREITVYNIQGVYRFAGK